MAPLSWYRFEVKCSHMKKSAVRSLTASRSLAKVCRGMTSKGVDADGEDEELVDGGGRESQLWVSARTKPITYEPLIRMSVNVAGQVHLRRNIAVMHESRESVPTDPTNAHLCPL